LNLELLQNMTEDCKKGKITIQEVEKVFFETKEKAELTKEEKLAVDQIIISGQSAAGSMQMNYLDTLYRPTFVEE
jgi:hypothetical protein